LGGDEFPRVPELERAYRAAHRALEDISTPGLFAPEEERSHVTEVIRQLLTVPILRIAPEHPIRATDRASPCRSIFRVNDSLYWSST
jgi:hypothetical protein